MFHSCRLFLWWFECFIMATKIKTSTKSSSAVKLKRARVPRLQSLRWKPNTLTRSWVSVLMVSPFLSSYYMDVDRWSCDCESGSLSDLPFWLLRALQHWRMLVIGHSWSSLTELYRFKPHKAPLLLLVIADAVESVLKETWNDDLH